MMLLRVGAVCGIVQLSSQKKAVQFLVAGAAALSRVHATFRSASLQDRAIIIDDVHT
jgi:hypothetical protein